MAQPNAQPLPQPQFDVLANGFQQIVAGYSTVLPEITKLPNINPVVLHQAMMNQFDQMRRETADQFAHMRQETADQFAHMRQETADQFAQLRQDIAAMDTRLNNKIDALGTRLDRRIDGTDAKVDNLDRRFDAMTTNTLAISSNSKHLKKQTLAILEPLVDVRTSLHIPDFPRYPSDIPLMPRPHLESVLLALGYQTHPTQTDNDLQKTLERRVGLDW